MKKYFTLFLIAMVFTQANAQLQYISADNPSIEYIGRFDFSDPNAVRYDWPGTTIQFMFTGKKLQFIVEGGERNYFNVFIDDNLHEVMHAPNDTVYEIAGVKGKGWHKCLLQKRTEGEMGTTIFKGINISAKAQVKKCEGRKLRKIEFIGNSITCGYGTEGASRDEDFLPETENVNKSYAFITARAFNAECYVTAHSGLGVVRNYGDKDKVSTKLATMTDRYTRVMDEDSLLIWDFSNWKPDMVVINLGTNDYSTNIQPDKVIFQRRYELFIRQVRDNYGDIPIFCINGPMHDEPAYSIVKEIVESSRLMYEDKNLYFIGIPTFLLNKESDLGSDWHPSYRGQRKMAAHIIPVIANILKWTYSDNELRFGNEF